MFLSMVMVPELVEGQKKRLRFPAALRTPPARRAAGNQANAPYPSTSSGTNIQQSNFKGHHIPNYDFAFWIKFLISSNSLFSDCISRSFFRD